MSSQHRSDASQQGALQAATLAQGYARLRCLSMRDWEAPWGGTCCTWKLKDRWCRHLSCDCAALALLYFSPCQGKQGTAFSAGRVSWDIPLCSVWTIHTAAPIVHQVSPKSMQPPQSLLIASGSPTFRQEWAKPTGINRTLCYFSL